MRLERQRKLETTIEEQRLIYLRQRYAPTWFDGWLETANLFPASPMRLIIGERDQKGNYLMVLFARQIFMDDPPEFNFSQKLNF